MLYLRDEEKKVNKEKIMIITKSIIYIIRDTHWLLDTEKRKLTW